MVSKVGYLDAALEKGFAAPEPVRPQAKRLRRIMEMIKSYTPTQRDTNLRLFLMLLGRGPARLDSSGMAGCHHGMPPASGRSGRICHPVFSTGWRMNEVVLKMPAT